MTSPDPRPELDRREVQERVTLLVADAGAREEDLAASVRRGLTAPQKFLEYRHLYDASGSRWFERICELPEYYLTRAETEILRREADGIARHWNGPVSLVELGSGAATKTRVLLDAFQKHGDRVQYVPIDVSGSALVQSAAALVADYAELQVLGVVGTYLDGLHALSRQAPQRRLILWLGSSIGNFHRPDAVLFLAGVVARMRADDRFLLGADLRKDPAVLKAAYDDAQGVTAEFITNILRRINRELQADFETSRFRYRVEYDEDAGRVEMYLDSQRAQRVRIAGLDLEVELAAGEPIHVENSYKSSPEEIRGMAEAAGLAADEFWTDAARRFSLSWLRPDR